MKDQRSKKSIFRWLNYTYTFKNFWIRPYWNLSSVMFPIVFHQFPLESPQAENIPFPPLVPCNWCTPEGAHHHNDRNPLTTLSYVTLANPFVISSKLVAITRFGGNAFQGLIMHFFAFQISCQSCLQWEGCENGENISLLIFSYETLFII